MADGFLLVDKSSRWTSHDVVAKVRRPAEAGVDAGEPGQLPEVELVGHAIVDGHDLDAAARQQPGRGAAGETESVDQGTAPVEWISRHLSFNVDRPSRAKRIDSTQKRTMIFGSAQPASSK